MRERRCRYSSIRLCKDPVIQIWIEWISIGSVHMYISSISIHPKGQESGNIGESIKRDLIYMSTNFNGLYFVPGLMHF